MRRSASFEDVLKLASAFAGPAPIGPTHLFAAILGAGGSAARFLAPYLSWGKVRDWLARYLWGYVAPAAQVGILDSLADHIVQLAESAARLRYHVVMDEEHLLLALLETAQSEPISELNISFGELDVDVKKACVDLVEYLDDPRFPYEGLAWMKGMSRNEVLFRQSARWVFRVGKFALGLPRLFFVREILFKKLAKRTRDLEKGYVRHGNKEEWLGSGGGQSVAVDL